MIRKISALYGHYSFELGVDLRESITIADLGDAGTRLSHQQRTPRPEGASRRVGGGCRWTVAEG